MDRNAYKDNKWKIEDLYKSEEDFNKELKKLETKVQEYSNYKGKILESSDTLLSFLKFDTEFSKRLEQLFIYAHINNDSDTRDSHYQELYGKVINLNALYNELTSYVVPELLENDYALIERYKVKANDVNEDNTVNFKVLEYNDNGKSYKVEHRSRMSIYMTLVAAFKERDKVDKEWDKICYKIISQHDINFLLNEPNKNRWFDKYNDYKYMVDGDCLLKFGYEINRLFQPQKIEFYKPDVEYTLKENEFLSDIDINFSKDKVNHIFAGCGFGKTTWAKKLGKTNKVCFISPLTSINKSAFTDDNVELENWIIIDSNFVDTAKHLYDGNVKEALLSNWNICTTWESFVLYEMYNINFDYVIIDEIHTLYMYDYRLTSINNIKRYFQLAKGIKIVMTGTPSLEVKDFDCFKIKINKEQYKVNANLVFYNSQCKGYIYNDIKEWIKDKNHFKNLSTLKS